MWDLDTGWRTSGDYLDGDRVQLGKMQSSGDNGSAGLHNGHVLTAPSVH